MGLREDGANIESHELHQANFTDGVLYDLPHFRIRSRGSNVLSELAHIGPADCSFPRGDDSFEWLLRNDAPSLDIDRAHFHTFEPQGCLCEEQCSFLRLSNRSLGQTRFQSPLRRLGRRNIIAVVAVSIHSSSHWRALPPRHCSAFHYAWRRRDAALDSCRPSRLLCWQVLPWSQLALPWR